MPVWQMVLIWTGLLAVGTVLMLALFHGANPPAFCEKCNKRTARWDDLLDAYVCPEHGPISPPLVGYNTN